MGLFHLAVVPIFHTDTSRSLEQEPLRRDVRYDREVGALLCWTQKCRSRAVAFAILDSDVTPSNTFHGLTVDLIDLAASHFLTSLDSTVESPPGLLVPL